MRIRSAQRTPSLLPSILPLQHRSGDQILEADLAVEAMMAHVLHLQQTYRRMLGGVRATIGAILGAVTAEHTLALRAATKAASPRQSLAEVRAMYVPSEPHQHRTEPGGQKRE
jgi:hypothetical protein